MRSTHILHVHHEPFPMPWSHHHVRPTDRLAWAPGAAGLILSVSYCLVPIVLHAAHWPGSMDVVGIAAEGLNAADGVGVVAAPFTSTTGSAVLLK